MIALVTLFGMRRLLAAMEQHLRLRRVLTRRPAVVMRDGLHCAEALRRTGFSDDDLRQRLRLAGVSDRSQVRLAVLERTVEISVLRGDAAEPWLLADFDSE